VAALLKHRFEGRPSIVIRPEEQGFHGAVSAVGQKEHAQYNHGGEKGGLVCLSCTFYPACRLILNRPVANGPVKNTLAL